MDKDDKITAIKVTIVETMVDNYQAYGQQSGMSQEEINNLINENIESVTLMSHAVAEKIYNKLFE